MSRSTDKIETLAQLEALYGSPAAASLDKVTDHLTPSYRRFVEQAPFFVLATSGPRGIDCSPRGDMVPGAINVVDEHTLMIPDRRGNNRIDTLRNIIEDPRIGLIFLIPGVNETLRITGEASILADPDLCVEFAVDGKVPVTVVKIAIRSVYFQCARALLRSNLWVPVTWENRKSFPTAGQMIADANASFDGEAYDGALPGRQAKTLY